MKNTEKSCAGEYRYGFNGMEKDDELKGNGNYYTSHLRGYDPRLARWISVDPESNQLSWQSPYVSFDNNPIIYVDPDGDIVRIRSAVEENGKIKIIKAPREIRRIYKEAIKYAMKNSPTFRRDFRRAQFSLKTLTIVDNSSIESREKMVNEDGSPDKDRIYRRNQYLFNVDLPEEDKNDPEKLVKEHALYEDNIDGSNASTVNEKAHGSGKGTYIVINLKIHKDKGTSLDFNYAPDKGAKGGLGLLIHEFKHSFDYMRGKSEGRSKNEDNAVQYQNKVGKEISEKTNKEHVERETY
ncbi:MAG: RHS repeat domain-containing protein [Cytophagaceae bacterium]